MKICQNCKHRQKPNGKFITRGWCNNPKSPNAQSYIYKGDTCDEFVSLKAKKKPMKSSVGKDGIYAKVEE